jgi:hypothetical protein
MYKSLRYAGMAVALCSTLVSAQIVAFNAPSEWLTQRNDEFVARVIFDTSRVNKKNVRFDLYSIVNGKKSKVASKSVKVVQSAQDIVLGKTGGVVFGGNNFAKIEWIVVETKEKGEIGPVGVVNLDKIGAYDSLMVKKTAAGDVAGVAQAVGDKWFLASGAKTGVSYDDKNLYVAFAKNPGMAGQKVTVGVDGKNAKSAFLSYADRFISWYPGSDSVTYTHCARVFMSDSISYREEGWRTEATVTSNDTYVLVAMPWFDLGMAKPFKNRKFGLTVLVFDDKGKKTASAPAKSAELRLPGTWANVVLEQ